MSDNSAYASLGIGVLALVLALAGVVLPESSPSGSFAPYPATDFYSYPTLTVGAHWVQQDLLYDVLYANLFITTRRIHVENLRFNVYVAGDSGCQCRMGIYSDDGGQYPNGLVVDAGAVSTDSTGYKTLSVDVWLDAGYYYFALLQSSVFFTKPKLAYCTASLFHVVAGTLYTKTGVSFGPLPDPFPSNANPSMNAWGVMWEITEFE